MLLYIRTIIDSLSKAALDVSSTIELTHVANAYMKS